MRFLAKIWTALTALKRGGIHFVISLLREKCGLPIPQSVRSRWMGGIASEIMYWDLYFQGQRSKWDESCEARMNPDAKLQQRPAALLPQTEEAHILDVGAGPLTYLGKRMAGTKVRITAVDSLAPEYDLLLKKHNIQPLVRTQLSDAEHLTDNFGSDSFDLVVARNCIDHSYDPLRAIVEMVKVVKPECYVLLEHRPNEGTRRKHGGLHQWNLSATDCGDFIIESLHSSINVSRQCSALCDISCELAEEGHWLITRIRKKCGTKTAVTE